MSSDRFPDSPANSDGVIPHSAGLSANSQEVTQSGSELISSPVCTTGQVFLDGSVIELISNSENPSSLDLLLATGEKTQVGSDVMYLGRTYRSAELAEVWVRTLKFPKDRLPSGSARDLFDELAQFFACREGQPAHSSALLAVAVLESWLHDALSFPVGWSITAADREVAQRIAWRLLLLCRRAFLYSAGSLAGLGSLPMALQPTLIIPTALLSSRALSILLASHSMGSLVLVGDRWIDLRCPKILVGEVPSDDVTLTQGWAQIPVGPPEQPLPALDPAEDRELAERLQAKLLDCRIRMLARIRDFDLGDLQLSPTAPSVARSLAVCFLDDAEMPMRIEGLLQSQLEDEEASQTMGPESALIEAMLHAIHSGRTRLRVFELAETANTILLGRGEPACLSPRGLDPYFKAFGLYTRRLGSKGRGLVLDAAVCDRVHLLAWRWGVRSIESDTTCRTCARFRSQVRTEAVADD